MHMLDGYASPTDILVVKYGGNSIPPPGAPDPMLAELAQLWAAGTKVVLVHGGGPEIDAWLALRDISPQRIDGLRVTDAQTLEVTEAVLCGTLNKRLVRNLIALGTRAVGVSGEDAATLTSGPAAKALGFVGTEVSCDPGLITALLDAGYLPVIAPLALDREASTALNVNADSAAASIAGALRASAFVMLTNVKRVLRNANDAASGIDRMSLDDARAFAMSPACQGGMRPKVLAAVDAAAAGAKASYITAAAHGAIRSALGGQATVITAA
jgi:acetylglutamate kinase